MRQQLAAQTDDIDQARLQHAVTRADTLFAQHVALDGTKAVERHRLAARKTGLQHRYVTTKQHGVYKAIRETPDIRLSKPRRQRRSGQHTVPVNNPHRRPVNRVPKPAPAPAPVVHNANWRKQHRTDTPRPPGFGGNRRVHFAPAARRLHQGPAYHNPFVFTRLDNNNLAYKGHYQLAPYRPPQLFPKYAPHPQPYQPHHQKHYKGLPWKTKTYNYYEPLLQG
ncbi:hypothetical protein KFL_005690070 [Klebsormidium nitens]|uniref:Uncharacterized protein n=1 Tax=Klebsormidium nitens TaxID=105231 RepID=A0A1Y1IGT8_KLENI|nr:hypothetical protein KFL_005690070 [Klebsormidium nitens]|eukprot:GAQ89853.1 hypothetical protein KFL_005690070 [Klebsormidium nitens]